MAAADPVLSARGLGVQFPGSARRTPAHLDLQVAPGDRILVLGPSGCGKSSLLKAIAGVIPDIIDGDVYGDLEVAGLDHLSSDVAKIADIVGYLGQDPLDQIALPRVDDEVAFGLENAGRPVDEITRRVRSALDDVGALHLTARDTATLSGGQLQRVALAAVLARRPRLLLADEPTAMLDPAAASAVHDLLLHRDNDERAIVVVDHRLDDVSALPERLVVLDADGRVVADGPTREVMLSAADPIAASGSWLPLGVEAARALGRRPTAADLDDPEAALDELTATLPSNMGILDQNFGDVVIDARGAAFGPAGRRTSGETLVSGIDLRLRRGEVTAIIGANGSGKTTLLSGLAGLSPTLAGDVRRDGQVGLVFQFPERQFLARTVAAEIEYGAKSSDSVERALVEFDLSEVRDRNPFAISGGQQRRLSIAAVAVTDPAAILLDEPTFGQDRRHVIELAATIGQLARGGRAVGIVTHDPRVAAWLADRVVVMHDGAIAASGNADTVLRDLPTLHASGVVPPRLLSWWAGHVGIPLRGLIDVLHGDLVGAAT